MFCEQLKSFRKQMNLSQQQIAKMLNVTQQCYFLWEKGVNEPNFEMLKKLCAIFNCTADELLEMENKD